MKTWTNLRLNQKLNIVILAFVMMLMLTFAFYIFITMRNNMIDYRIRDIELTLESKRNSLLDKVNNIIILSNYVSKDQEIITYLSNAQAERLTTEDNIDFKNQVVKRLERNVNTNYYIHNIRINSSVITNEIHPILYYSQWGELGWQYETSNTVPLVSYSQAIQSIDGRQLGVVKVTMALEEFMDNADGGKDGRWLLLYTPRNKSVHHIYEKLNLPESIYTVALTKTATVVDLEGERYIVSAVPIEGIDSQMMMIYDMGPDDATFESTAIYFVLGFIAILALMIIAINMIVKRLLKRFYYTVDIIHQVGHGNEEIYIDIDGNDEVSDLAQTINGMIARNNKLMIDNVNREVVAKDTQIKALQSQINAHFFYNVLESIKMMAEIKGEFAISDALTHLGKLTRYSIKWQTDMVTLKEEIDYVQNYLHLVNMRRDKAIDLKLNFSENMYGQLINKMTLQPIVENSVIHGLNNHMITTSIEIGCYYRNNDCVIEIIDYGKGIPANKLMELRSFLGGQVDRRVSSGHGIALKNVHDRIYMKLGAPYGINIDSRENEYTRVQVFLPRDNEKVTSDE